MKNMMTHGRHLMLLSLLGLAFAGCSQSGVKQPAEKAIYQPEEFKGEDWTTDTNRYSFNRMANTENMAILWEQGFGDNLSDPPQLEGQPMQVDLENLQNQLEYFYRFYRDTLQFVKPGSLSEKYRMMVMVNYSLEGTAYGGTYDDTIGALWVTPNRLQDKKLNTVAHELGHSFQAQISADKTGECWNGNPIFEMCSQWMLWQVNPQWVADENYHWQAFKENTHKSFLSLENMYRSPYVLEYWSENLGKPYIGELFRQGKGGEDPVLTHQRLQGMNQEQFNDDIFRAYCQVVNFDYPRVYAEMRPWANSFAPFSASLQANGNGWYQVAPDKCPENYGVNIIALAVPETGATVQAALKGVKDARKYNTDPSKAGWRWGFVGVTADGRSLYSEAGSKADVTIDFTVPAAEPLAALWLVVMGAPREHEQLNYEMPAMQWPYQLQVTGTSVL